MMNKLVQGILTASLIVTFSEAVLSCDAAEGASAVKLQAEHWATLQTLHYPAVLLGLGTLVLFIIRKFKGIVILLFTVAALAISPGWYYASADIASDCGPIGGFGVKVVLGVVAACFFGQLAFWIVERRRAKSV